MDSFKEEALSDNGFQLPEDKDFKLCQKQRKKPNPTSNDIYDIATSIKENHIKNKLAYDILKPEFHSGNQNNDPIMGSHSKVIIQKLQELINVQYMAPNMLVAPNM